MKVTLDITRIKENNQYRCEKERQSHVGKSDIFMEAIHV